MDFILAFSKLSDKIKSLQTDDWERLIQQATGENPWFTAESIEQSLGSIAIMIEKEKLQDWVSRYPPPSEKKLQVGLILAGNIPLVGFHDILSTIFSGHQAVIKLSSKDSVLIKTVLSWLVEITPEIQERFVFQESLKEVDAIIATGSNNSARYFEYYFSRFPNIIRKNRTSIAILTGEESDEDLLALGSDVFQYFGLGCRNVSKIMIPEGYDLVHLLDQWQPYKKVQDHYKYMNNYDYHKSIYLVNKEEHLDTGFSLVKESTDELVSPISVTYYEYYPSPTYLNDRLASQQDSIQCIVGKHSKADILFGKSQSPELWDYADQVDTMKFLSEL